MEEWTQKYTKYEVMDILGKAGVTVGACLNARDIHSDPQLLERGMIVTIDHPHLGDFTLPGSPIQMSNSPLTVTAAPLLGQHTSQVLGDLLGYTEDTVKGLEAEGVV